MKKIIIGLLLSGASYGYAQQAPANLAKRLDSLFTAPGNSEHLNGGVLIAENGKVIYQRTFGYADLSTKKPNTLANPFNIGSNTKTFTSTAILQLMEKGKLKLDDPVRHYFPEFPYENVTVRHLLTHTSGLSDFDMYFAVLKGQPGKVFTNQDIIPAILTYHKPLKFQPGENFDYCNTNFELLALLVEKLSGMTYPVYLKKYIFTPAGMTHSYVQTEREADTARVSNYMPGKLYDAAYHRNDSVPQLHPILHNLGMLYGDGGIISTLSDMLRYDQALYNGKLLKPQTLELAYTANQLINGKDYNMYRDLKMGHIHYGLGWLVDADTSAGHIISHSGHYPGIWSAFVRNIDKKQTIITYDNKDWSGADLIARMALDILNGRPVKNILNKRSLAREYGESLKTKGPDIAYTQIIAHQADTSYYILKESNLNDLGYAFMADGYLPQALETFKVVTLLFPGSANAYESYGEALDEQGDKTEAILLYQKALMIDPKNRDAQDRLKKLDPGKN